MPPSNHPWSIWVVEAWEKVPHELIRNACEWYGYKSVDELQNVDNSIRCSTDLLYHSIIVQVLEEAGGVDYFQNLFDPENEIINI